MWRYNFFWNIIEKSRGQVSCLRGEETKLNEQAATIDQCSQQSQKLLLAAGPHISFEEKKKSFTITFFWAIHAQNIIPEMSNRSAGQQFAFIQQSLFFFFLNKNDFFKYK
jgi:hypothetical protein